MGATTLADQAAKPKTLFTNVHVFDGVHEKRIENAYVLVEGNRIKQVSAQKITATCAQSQPWDCLTGDIPLKGWQDLQEHGQEERENEMNRSSKAV